MKLYFVGTAAGHKRNSYVAVSADREASATIAAEKPELQVFEKDVDMRPRRRRARK